MSARTIVNRKSSIIHSAAYQLSPAVLDRLWLERLRQKHLLREGKIPFDCASPIVSQDRKLRVLTEELGEVAEAIDQVEAAAGIPLVRRKKEAARILRTQRHLRDELAQVAAVAIAWLESMEERKP